jgi:hypothetical protein
MMSELQSLFPDFALRVLTDDVNALVPPPASGSYADWQLTYSRYADFLLALERLSFEHAGLSLNLDKAGLLLPPGAPLPSDEVRARFPPLFDFQQQGFRVAGSPIGTDTFMQAFVDEKVKDAQSKVVSIKVLGRKSPRAAHRLLTCCASKLMSYLLLLYLYISCCLLCTSLMPLLKPLFSRFCPHHRLSALKTECFVPN